MKIEKQEQKLFLFAVILSFVARASAFVSPTFNVDDLWGWHSNLDFHNVGDIAFREGRFSAPWLMGLLDALGMNASLAFSLSAALLTTCLAVTSVLVCRIWKINDNGVASALAVAVLSLHPYQTDIYTWKVAMLSGGIPFLMTFLALIIAPQGLAKFALSVVLIVSALGIHQIPLEYAAAALVLAIPIGLIRRNFLFGDWLRMALSLTLATILYVIVAKLTILYTSHSVSIGRDKLILFSNPRLVLIRIEELAHMAVLRDPLIGWLTRAIFGALFLVVCISIFFKRPVSIGRSIILLFCLSGGLLLAFLCAISLTVVPAAWMPVFRNMMSMGLVWASVPVLAYCLSNAWIKKIIVGTVALMLIGFAGVNGQILSDQQRANVRDVLLVNRISADIEKLPDFRNIKRIAFVGTNISPIYGLKTGADLSTGWYNYGTTLSVFSVPWTGYLLQLYSEVNGPWLAYVNDEAEISTAQNYCEESKQKWPESAAIKSMGEWVVVCLGPYQKPVKGPFEPLQD